MNARLRAFLDRFGFGYSFKSATECYRSGTFDQVLLRVLERHAEIVKVVTPILGAERAATYSPFLPDLAQDRPRPPGPDRGAAAPSAAPSSSATRTARSPRCR